MATQQQDVEIRPAHEINDRASDISWSESYRQVTTLPYYRHLFSEFGIDFDPELHAEIIEQARMVLIPIGVAGGVSVEITEGQNVMQSHDLVSKAVVVSHLVDDYIDFPALHERDREELERLILTCTPDQDDSVPTSVTHTYSRLKGIILAGIRDAQLATTDLGGEVIRGDDQTDLLVGVLEELEGSLAPENLTTFQLSLIRLTTAGLAQTVPYFQKDPDTVTDDDRRKQSDLMRKYREFGLSQLHDPALIEAKRETPDQIEVSTASSSQEMFQVFEGEVDFDLLEAWNNILGIAVYANKSQEEREVRQFGFYEQPVEPQNGNLQGVYRNLIETSWAVIRQRILSGDCQPGTSNYARLVQFRLVHALLSRSDSAHSFTTIDPLLGQMLRDTYKEIDSQLEESVPATMLAVYLGS